MLDSTSPTESEKTIADTQRRCEACGGSYTGPVHLGCAGRGSQPTEVLTPSSKIDELPPETRPFAEDSTRQLHQYILVSKLGQGGMGEVWKAWDRKLTRWVAIKFLLGQSDEAVLRFRREAKLAGRLNHPNIAAVHEVGEAPARQPGKETVPFIAMQFIEGATLADVKLPLPGLIDLFLKIALALEHAHRVGIIHRDLKPANIMVSRDGWPYVMDFGLARTIEGESGLSVTGAVMGTPAFMPPEQVEGKLEGIGPWSDVYSLGATMYAAFCGIQPFAAQTTLQVLTKVCNEIPVPPRKHNPGIPQALETGILKAMAKNRADRYPTMASLAEDLRQILATANAPAAAEKSTGGRRGVAVAALALLALGTGLASWFLLFRPPPPTPQVAHESGSGAPGPAAKGTPAPSPGPELVKAEAKGPVPLTKVEPRKPEPEEKPPAPATGAPSVKEAEPPPQPRGLGGVELTPAQVTAALRSGGRFLAAEYRSRDFTTDTDALAAYALLLSGGAEDPGIAIRLGRFLRGPGWAKSPRTPYAAALRSLALEACGDPALRPHIAECAQYVIEAQGPGGRWGPTAQVELNLSPSPEPAVYVYGGRPLETPTPQDLARKGNARNPVEGDAADCEYALLTLQAAERSGIRAPRETWTRAISGLLESSPETTGSSAAAGAVSIVLCRRALGDSGGAGRGTLESRITWLAAHFSIDREPGAAGASANRWLACLERAGTLLETPFVGHHEWYPEGAKHLLGRQRSDGSWSEGGDALGPTAAAILFLGRATERSFRTPDRGPSGILETRVVGAAPNFMFLLDASGAMRTDFNGRERLEAAKEILTGVVERLPEGAMFGLRVFGARYQALEPGADIDTQLVVEPGPIDKRQAKTHLRLIRVRGKAPLTLSLVEMSKDLLKFPPDLDLSVILLIDGRESDRRANPEAAAADLMGSRRGMKLHIVGFNDDDEEIQERLGRIAAAGGGRYIKAKNTKDLLSQVLSAAVKEDGFVVLGAEGKEVLRGHLGEPQPLPEGRYTFVCGQGAARLEQPFWINANLVTRLFVDAGKLPGAK